MDEKRRRIYVLSCDQCGQFSRRVEEGGRDAGAPMTPSVYGKDAPVHRSTSRGSRELALQTT